MKIDETPKFRKSFKERIALHQHLVEQFGESLGLFVENTKNPELKDHSLTGTMYGYRSFLVTNDLIVIYREVHDGIILYDRGSHDQVYSR